MEKDKPTLDECKSRKKVPTTPVIPDLKFKLFENNPESDPFGHLQGFKDREDKFLEALNESIDKENSDENYSKMCEQECQDYINPLLGRTRESISTLLATRDSLDQLDNLHRLVKRLLIIQEQNFHMRKRLATVRTIQALKSMEVSDFSLIVYKSLQVFFYFVIRNCSKSLNKKMIFFLSKCVELVLF
jgi:hypothetical protein